MEEQDLNQNKINPLYTLLLALLFILILSISIINIFLKPTITVALSPSLAESGLFEIIISKFQNKSGIKVKIVSADNQRIFQLAKEGNVDAIIIQEDKNNLKFIEGLKYDITPLFYSKFVIVGPKNDPARIKYLKKSAHAFKKIVDGKFIFVSGGKFSETYSKELEIWEQAGISPEGHWYIKTESVPSATLIIADAKDAYCLTNISTYQKNKEKLEITLLLKEDPYLFEKYSIINIKSHKTQKQLDNSIKTFINYLLSLESKNIINNFKLNGERIYKSF